MSRVYLDWNATAPLRPEARAAMIAAMDVVGNPSSVHAEGRAAKGLLETARAQVAELVGCDPSEVVFTSGATEASQYVLMQVWDDAVCSPIEHDSVSSRALPIFEDPYSATSAIKKDGVFRADFVSGFGVSGQVLKKGDKGYPNISRGLLAITAANSETGIIQPFVDAFREFVGELEVSHRFCDATQAVGKIAFNFGRAACEYSCCSAHKFGGPKGIGTLITKQGIDVDAILKGGGQEMGRRSGTENVIGIAGFGAAAAAAQRDLADGVWDRVAELRDRMEEVLLNEAPDILIFGKDVARLPNTSCFAIPGWKGETQVMQMDLAGYAISAGSACSSGKVKESRVLRAMGFDSETASSAIRVSLGPTTTEDEIMGFARTWIEHYRRFKQRAA